MLAEEYMMFFFFLEASSPRNPLLNIPTEGTRMFWGVLPPQARSFPLPHSAAAGAGVWRRKRRRAYPHGAVGERGLWRAHCYPQSPGLQDHREQVLLLFLEGIHDEDGKSVEGGSDLVQLGLQAANLLLQVLAAVVQLRYEVVHHTLHLQRFGNKTTLVSDCS